MQTEEYEQLQTIIQQQRDAGHIQMAEHYQELLTQTVNELQQFEQQQIKADIANQIRHECEQFKHTCEISRVQQFGAAYDHQLTYNFYKLHDYNCTNPEKMQQAQPFLDMGLRFFNDNKVKINLSDLQDSQQYEHMFDIDTYFVELDENMCKDTEQYFFRALELEHPLAQEHLNMMYTVTQYTQRYNVYIFKNNPDHEFTHCFNL